MQALRPSVHRAVESFAFEAREVRVSTTVGFTTVFDVLGFLGPKP